MILTPILGYFTIWLKISTFLLGFILKEDIKEASHQLCANADPIIPWALPCNSDGCIGSSMPLNLLQCFFDIHNSCTSYFFAFILGQHWRHPRTSCSHFVYSSSHLILRTSFCDELHKFFCSFLVHSHLFFNIEKKANGLAHEGGILRSDRQG